MRTFSLILALIGPATPAFAQADQSEEAAPTIVESRETRPGANAESSVGVVGQRRTSDTLAGIRPTARLASRIQNRVQLRLRTRIDRLYQSQIQPTSPFEVAEEEARAAGRPRR